MLLANRKRTINRVVALMLVSVGLWALAVGCVHANLDRDGEYVRTAVASMGLFLPSLWLLRITIVRSNQNWADTLRQDRIPYFGGLLYVVLVYSPWFIPYGSTELNPLRGPIRQFIQYTPIILLFIVMGHMIRDRRTLIGMRRFEATFMVISATAAVILVLLRNILRDVLPNDVSPAWSGIIVATFLAVLLYGILAKRILDSKTLGIKMASYLLAVGLTVVAVAVVRVLSGEL